MHWRNRRYFFSLLMLMMAFQWSSLAQGVQPIKVGGKKFTESYILGEIIAQLLESRGLPVERQLGLGGTMIAYQALKTGGIDVYVEYTGTLSEAILKTSSRMDLAEIQRQLAKLDMEILPSLGFNNSYAIAVQKEMAEANGWERISDLRSHALRAAFHYEFLKREDGWLALKNTYGLDFETKPLEHSLIYEAIRNDEADLIVIYSTDPKVQSLNLSVLLDDLEFFPKYLAVPLIRKNFPKEARDVLKLLAGTIDEKTMTRLNGLVELRGLSYAEAARQFLVEKGLVSGAAKNRHMAELRTFLRRVGEHLYLAFLGIFSAVIVAVPLGSILLRVPNIAQVVLTGTGLLQTIPSIALLAFMIPFFGIGVKAAIMALMLYSLLPILRNTYVALKNLDPQILEAARGVGLYRWEIYFLIRLPLALPVILAGIRTAAVINIGTATLAAFIGAGGLGEPIVTGLALNDVGLILQGAIPAALLAVGVEVFFTWLERQIKPRLMPG